MIMVFPELNFLPLKFMIKLDSKINITWDITNLLTTNRRLQFGKR